MYIRFNNIVGIMQPGWHGNSKTNYNATCSQQVSARFKLGMLMAHLCHTSQWVNSWQLSVTITAGWCHPASERRVNLAKHSSAPLSVPKKKIKSHKEEEED